MYISRYLYIHIYIYIYIYIGGRLSRECLKGGPEHKETQPARKDPHKDPTRIPARIPQEEAKSSQGDTNILQDLWDFLRRPAGRPAHNRHIATLTHYAPKHVKIRGFRNRHVTGT